MHLTTRNVNTAFRELVYRFNGIVTNPEYVPITRRPSRNGSVLVIDEPVTITYTHPRERVLFNAARDANPFALLYEALWMMAGRNDVEPLAYYTKRFRDYSDDGTTLNGAYGYRWRHHERLTGDAPINYEEIDQLDILVSHLRADPTSRRAVLQMWNVEDDLLKIGEGNCTCRGPTREGERHYPGCRVKRVSKDVCCNLSVMFSLREHRRSAQGVGVPDAFDRYLDMTVTNRSNDLVWGLLGADYMTFSILQEYMAARLGAEVGKYHHFTNNLHVYDDPGNPKVVSWSPEKWLADKSSPVENYHDKLVPLVRDPEAFERELPLVVDSYGPGPDWAGVGKEWDEPFFNDVVHPMFMAHRCYKMRDFNGLFQAHINEIAADDWRIACINWLNRRVKGAK